MRKLLFLLSIFAIILSCSSDETSTPVTPPPAPIVKYTITLSAGEGGTVSSTGGEYEAGQTVNVTATPQGEYVFTSWSDGNTNATRTITISSNSTLTANFEKRKYPLTVNFEGEGEVIEEIVDAGRTTDYDSGTTVKLTAQAATEWVFIGWTGDIESTEESVQIVIGESKEVTAIFEKKKYPLSVNIEGEGEVIEEIVEAGRTTDYDSGTIVKLTAQPTDEWLFTGWSGDIGDIDPTENPIQLNIIESKTVTATFEKKKYPLTVNIEGEGEVLEEIVNTGRTTDYDSGTTVKLTAVPAEGWGFIGWTGAIESNELEVQILVNEQIDISAEFVELAYPFSNYHNLNYFDTAYKTRVPYLHRNYETLVNSYGRPLLGNDFTSPPRCAVVLDYNGDGYMDLMHSGTDYKKSFDGIEDRSTIQFFKGNKYGYLSLDEENSSKFVGMIHSMKGVVNDFNGDGLPDVLFAGTGIHGNQDNPPPADGSFNKEYPVMIINDKNNIFKEIRFTELSNNYDHSVASGDIDNDGDVDVVFVQSLFPLLPNEFGSYEHLEYGKILVNDGNANFTVRKIVGPAYYFRSKITMELYDIDKDGYLDLFLSGEDDKEFTGVFGQSPSVVLFGDGLDFDNRLIELPNVEGFKRGYDFNFYDFDNDGYTDIILYRIPTDKIYNYEGYYIQVLKNVLNKEFIDVTSDVISENFKLGPTNNPAFIMTSDFDGDGTVELFNNDLTRTNNFSYEAFNPNAYNYKLTWEIINGVFVKEE